MELKRIGSKNKQHYSYAFTEAEPEIRIDEDTCQIQLLVRDARDMASGSGRYDYTAVLAPQDIAAILRFMSDEPSAFKPGPLQSALEASAVPLLRLLSAASSLPRKQHDSHIE
jgi:hypothetical protein